MRARRRWQRDRSALPPPVDKKRQSPACPAVFATSERLSRAGEADKSRAMKRFDALIRKLRNNTNLDEEDLEAIRALPVHIKQVPAHTPVVLEGDIPSQCCLV